MKDRIRSVLLAAVTAALVSAVASADSPPDHLMQQGRIVVGGVPLEGDHQVTFRIYDASDTKLHEETEVVTFRSGYYAQMVGTGATGFLDYFVSGSAKTVGISVDGAAELTPKQPIVSVPYAIASYAVQGGPVTASSVAVQSGTTVTPVVDAAGNWVGNGHTVPCTSCVGSTEITDGTVTGADVKDGTLTGADVQDATLTGADVQDGTIGDVDISGGVLTASSVTIATMNTSLFNSSTYATAWCPANTVLLGGGCQIPAADVAANKTHLFMLQPSVVASNYTCGAYTTDVATTGRVVTAWAICGSTQ